MKRGFVKDEFYIHGEGYRETAVRLRRKGLTRAQIAEAMSVDYATADIFSSRIKRGRNSRRDIVIEIIAEAMTLYGRGHTIGEVSEKLDIAKSTVGRWTRSARP